MKIGIIVGSLRKESWNRKIAKEVEKSFPDHVEAEWIDISNLPFYNEDLDGDHPHDQYQAVRAALKKCDAYLFFTPEYNRSYAPAIKNVIDVGSRDPQGNPWAKKPAAIFSASMGGFGGMAGNHALRQAFIYVDLILMQQPEVYLAHVDQLFDENGSLNKDTKAFLAGATQAFVDFAKKILS